RSPLNDTNPFATRFVRPGAIEFILPDGVTLDGLVDQLDLSDWRGQILGPHGTGKSTLLHTLQPVLIERRREILWITQNQGERSLAVTAEQAASWNAQTLVIVDGYEQLSWLAKRWLSATCQRSGAGLLVTSHTDVGLPTLFTTQASEALACEVVAQILPDDAAEIAVEDVSRCYQQYAGNVRETLFALYDLYERRRSKRS
ncbi:MAG TPA: hypothetical protein VL096_16270, partial [Pirellulaceae bacterium]|nr:hypothetical protein [Pirellulaceae bacterium]